MRAISSCREPGDLTITRLSRWTGGWCGEGRGRNPVMHDREKSDGRVLPVKLPNGAQGGAAEVVEGRRPAKGNTASETRSGPSAGQGALSELGRVRRVAATDKEARFTALLHHVDVDRLRMAYFALRPKAAPGVDGVMGGLRVGPGGQPQGSPCSGPQGRVPGEAVSEGVHPEARWAAAAARGRQFGGQDPFSGRWSRC